MGMPWRDWQFWVVTALALWGAWMLLRLFVPARRNHDRRPGCRTCTVADNAAKPKHTALTVSAKKA